ncbi:MAG: hypothetical protein QN229_00920 [Desulfurococcaceae archaeon TW002]
MGRSYLIPVVAPLHDPKYVAEVVSRYVSSGLPVDEILNIVSSESIDTVPITKDDLAIVAPVTGGTEELIIKIADKAGYTLILPHEEMNSLPASLEAYSFLRFAKKSVTLIVEWPPSQKTSKFINSWKAVSRVSNYVIGLVGEPSPWLVYSAGKEVEECLREIMPNLKIVRVSLDDLYELISKVSDDEVGELVSKIYSGAAEVRIPSHEVVKALKVYVALKKLVGEYGLNTFTIRCFDLIKNVRMTACLAVSLLNSEGIVAGCEGDLPALITMMILKELSGGSVFMGNTSWVKEDEILITHCTIALKMTSKYELNTHFESGIGVGIAGHVPNNTTVTIARLDPQTHTLRIAKGKIIEGIPTSPKQCRTQLKIKIDGKTSQILEKPTGNHYVLTLGDLEKELQYVAEILNLTPTHF